MPEYRFSKLARLDLNEIADYSVDIWGVDQANRYLDGLDRCFALVAQSPDVGRRCDVIRPGYRRAEHGKHVIIYRSDHGGIFISRIVHERMLPGKHIFEDN